MMIGTARIITRPARPLWGVRMTDQTTAPTCLKPHWVAGQCQRPTGHDGNHQAWWAHSVVGWTDAQCSTGRVIVCKDIAPAGPISEAP